MRGHLAHLAHSMGNVETLFAGCLLEKHQPQLTEEHLQGRDGECLPNTPLW